MDNLDLLRIIAEETGIVVDNHETILDGWDNKVIKINNEYIYRFTRRETTQIQHIKEIDLLPVLNKSLTLQVPNPIHWRTSGKPPYYMAYKMISGEPLTKQAMRQLDQSYVTDTLGGFIKQLQAVNPNQFKHVPIYRPHDWLDQYQSLYKQVNEKLFPRLQSSTNTSIKRTFKTVLDTEYFHFTPTLIHRDLTSDHIMYEGSTIIGFIDWGDACFGDPAFDLTGFIMDYDAELVKQLTDTLEVPKRFLDRSLFYSKVSSFYGCLYGLDDGNENIVNSGLEKIKNVFI